MTEITLQRPDALWVLPAALVLIVLWRVMRRRAFVAFPLTELVALRAYRASRLRHAPTLLALAALPFLAVALTDPVVPYSEGVTKARGLDIVLVLDLSSSMEEIMGPSPSVQQLMASPGGRPRGETRLETTKKALLEFIGMRRDDRVGLVVFSDNAYVVSPLTFDHEYLRQYVGMVDNQILRNEGLTAIGDGINVGNSLLARQSQTRFAGSKVMVVFTDGEHNFGSDPVDAVKAADSAGTRVHMVGVNLPEQVKNGPEVTRLVAAVRQHGGRYLEADTAGELRRASQAIDRLEKGWLVQTRYVRNRPVYHYFAIPALVLLTCALLLRAVPYFIEVT
jgi:Ca-activated chloride channel family protein